MRIVAGKHRGLSLYEFEASNIRPTTDRVRENIFNKIQFGIKDSVVLDLFCGTGAVSLEFISRGAGEVISVDNNKNSVNLIKKNFAKAKEVINLIEKDYKVALDGLKNRKFDYIFLDPPFNSDFGENSIKIIADNKILDDNGIIIYEHLDVTKFKCPKELNIFDEKKYGTIVVSYLRWNL